MMNLRKKEKDKNAELEKWYNEEINKAITENEKKRLTKSYNKRKKKGRGKPSVWLSNQEEINAQMYKNDEDYKRNVDEKIKQSIASGESMANVAEGVSRAIATASALGGDMETAKELGKTANQLAESQKTMEDAMENNKNNTENKNDEITTDKETSIPSEVDVEKTPNTEEQVTESEKITKKEGEKSPKKSLSDLEKNATNQDKEAIEDSKLIEDLADSKKKGEKDLEEMNKYVDILNEKSSNVQDYYRENLPTSLIGMYLNGEFGDINDKKGKKDALRTLGYLIINGLGKSVVNASMVARGMSPNQESDIDKIRREKLEGALNRYNEKRETTMKNTLDQLRLNTELLNKFNIDLDYLKNNKIFEEVSKSRDRKNIERTLRAYKVAGNYLSRLSDDQKQNVFMAIMAMNSNNVKDAGIGYLTSTFGKSITNSILDIFNAE